MVYISQRLEGFLDWERKNTILPKITLCLLKI